jgi:hypothetical protein
MGLIYDFAHVIVVVWIFGGFEAIAGHGLERVPT